MCFEVVDLDRTTFRACRKHFESAGSQGAWLGLLGQPWHGEVVSTEVPGSAPTQICSEH